MLAVYPPSRLFQSPLGQHKETGLRRKSVLTCIRGTKIHACENLHQRLGVHNECPNCRLPVLAFVATKDGGFRLGESRRMRRPNHCIGGEGRLTASQLRWIMREQGLDCKGPSRSILPCCFEKSKPVALAESSKVGQQGMKRAVRTQ